MRKKLSVFIPMSIMVLMLAACGSSNNSTPSSSDVPNVKEETSTTGQIENSNNGDSSVDSSVDSTSTVETTTEAPTTTAEPETTTEAPTTTVEPETTTEAPTTTVEPETTTETPTTTVEPETTTEAPTTTVEPETTTEAPTTTVEPETTTEAPDEPNTPSGWDGGYDNLPSDGFDHIKVPTIDDFYDEGLSNDDGAFDFGNRPEWEEAWYDAYDEFLVALGSPVDDEGNVYPAFMSINPGYTQGYQYLYYGVNWSDDSNGWGDIVIMPVGLHQDLGSRNNYKGSYLLETSNFFYGEIDKELEDEYRAATTMMLSWICPNPSQVEKAIYDFHTDQVGNTILVKNVLENGFGSWVQIGDVDVCVYISDIDNKCVGVAIRNHQ